MNKIFVYIRSVFINASVHIRGVSCHKSVLPNRVLLIGVLLLYIIGISVRAQAVPDEAFGDLGLLTVPRVTNSYPVGAAAPGGRMVIAGSDHGNNGFEDGFVSLLSEDGAFVESFGDGGTVEMSTLFEWPWYGMYSVTATRDRIYVAGRLQNPTSSFYSKYILFSLRYDGTIDDLFGDNGVVILSDRGIRSIKLVSDGEHIYAVGTGEKQGENNIYRGFISQFNYRGLVDVFADTGVYWAAPGTHFSDLVVRQGGAIVASGVFQERAIFIGLTNVGDIDPLFGFVSYITGARVSVAPSVDLDRYGNLYVTGSFRTDRITVINRTFIWKINRNGQLDGSFGNDGMIDLDIDVALGSGFVESQLFGKEIAFVFRDLHNGMRDGMRLLLLNPDGSPDETNGPGGVAELFPGRGFQGLSSVDFVDGEVALFFGGVGTPQVERPGIGRVIVKTRPVIAELLVPTDFDLSIAPNPSGGATQLRFHLPEIEIVSITLFDPLGRAVVGPLVRSLPAGASSLDFDLGDVPPGVYSFRVASGTRTAVRRFSIVR